MEKINNEKIIMEKIRDHSEKLSNSHLSLIFSNLVIQRKQQNIFCSSEVIKLYNSVATEINLDQKRDFSREINEHSDNNSFYNNTNYFSIIVSNQKGKRNFKITRSGFKELTKIFNDKLNINLFLNDDIFFEKKTPIITETSELTLEEIIKNFKNRKFIIPHYQRGYVWDEKQATALLNSILKKYPINSFLNWKKNDNFYLIDGQQRIQTLIKIYEYPLKFVDYEIFNEFIDIDSETKIDKLNFVNKIENLRKKSLKELEFEAKNIPNYFINSCLNFARNVTTLNKQKFIFITIDNVNEDEIIDIFDRLNTKGTKLTEFEILASKWAKYSIEVKDSKWKNKIESLYNDNKINNINTREEINTPGEIFYIAILFSLDDTKYIKEIFRSKKSQVGDYKIDNSIHFALLWLFRIWFIVEKNIKINEAIFDDKFDIEIGEFIADVAKNNFSKIEKIVIDISDVWQEIETKVVILKEMTDNKLLLRSLSKNLFISLAAQILYKKLTEEKFRVNNNIQYHVIYEIINRGFSSATNSKVRKDICELAYLNEISPDQIRNIINNHNEAQLANPNLNGFEKGFSSTVKFIISIAYKFYTKTKSIDFHFDHIFPKNAMSKYDISYGINSIGNCGQLKSSENSSKQDKIDSAEVLGDKLIEYIENNKSINDFGLDRDNYEKILDTIKNTEFDHDKKNKLFSEFIEKRYKIIIDLFIDQIKIS